MNPIRITLTVLASCLFLAVNQAHAVVIDMEDFEDATADYVLFKADGVTPQSEFIEHDPMDFPSGYGYFGRFGTGGLSFPGTTGTTYNSPGGTGFFAANNTNDTAIGLTNQFTTAFMDFNGTDISNFTNLTFSGAFAESDGDSAIESWAANTSLQVLARIDGGSYAPIFAIASDGAGTPLVDTDFNGIGDGTEITNTFQTFMASITGTGNLLDLRVQFMNFTNDFADIGLDSLTLEGDAIVPIPEPTSFALLGALAACGGGYRLRRRRQTAEDVV